MTDWKSTCETFNQYTTTQYPNNCTMASARPVKDMMALSQTINTLAGKITSLGQTYSTTEDDKATLRNSMNTFCCAMWARNEYDERYKEAKQDYDIAKNRVDSLRNPPANLSYFGTLMPFPRPLRSDSVPVLLGISLVFLILALGMLLNLGNVQLAYVGPRSYGPGFLSQLGDSFRQTSWMVIAITMAVSAGAAGGIYYGIQKTRPEWLK
jgi:hypothetical protein